MWVFAGMCAARTFPAVRFRGKAGFLTLRWVSVGVNQNRGLKMATIVEMLKSIPDSVVLAGMVVLWIYVAYLIGRAIPEERGRK
jgi:hypothetical protein